MAYLQRIHPARIIPLMIAALATFAAFATAVNAAPVTSGPRYLVDARGGGQAFVIAYDALEYSVDGGEAVVVLAEDVGIVDLSTVTGPFAEIRLSSEAGYVVNVANDADYTSNNTSNDQMILARGRDRYVDTEFFVYNHVPTVNEYNPAKIIVTAQEATAQVTVTDLTGGMGTSAFEVALGQSTVVPLSESALLSITTDGAPVSVYYGILNDGAVEVVPTTSGGFIGTEAYVATPEFVGVVATGTGFIHITERVTNGGTEYDRTLLERSVTTGEALFVKTAHTTTGLFDGVTTVKVSGTAPFYAFAGIGSAFSTYYGSTFIPPVPGSNGAQYFVQTLHPERASYLDVAPLDAGTIVTVSKTERGVVVGTVAPASTENGVSTYQLPASQTRQVNVAAGYAKTVYLVEATGPVVVHERHAATVERGGIAISPDYEPQVPPSIGELEVTAIRVLDEGNWIVDERLRVAFNAIDVNRDLQSVVLTDPHGGVIDLTDYATQTDFGVDVNTDWEGIPYAYIPGTYTLTAIDLLGMETVRIDSIRDVSALDITAAQVNQPDNGAAGAELLPVYSWISPRFEYPSYYRFAVSGDETFSDAGQVVIPYSNAKVEGKVSAAHASYAQALNQDDAYGWRVMGVASTLRWGDDFAVVGPVWTFSTADAEDTTPPQFIKPPRVSNVTRDTVRVGWTTNEPTTAVVNVFALDGTPQTSIDVLALSDENIAAFVVGTTETLIWKLVVEITDQSGNTAQSDELLFHIEEEPDTADPIFMAGPAHVSVTDVKATLTWTTNEPTAWVVHYWPRGVDPIGQPDKIVTKQDLESLQLNRQVDLTNLIPDTLYSYQVQVVDASSNVTYSRIQQFRTPVGADTRPPGIIGRPVVRDRTATSALITWKTDEGAIGKVRYGLSREQLDWSAGNPDARLTMNHEIRLTGLTAATHYFFAAHSVDASRNTSISDTLDFVTLAIPDTEGPRIRPAGQGGVDKGTVVINRSDRMPVAKWNTNEDHTAVITITSDPAVGEDGVFSNQAATVKVYSVTDFDSHHRELTLTGLQPDTQYWAQIIATDRVGNRTVGVPIDFATSARQGEVDITAPTLVGKVNVRVTPQNADTFVGTFVMTFDEEVDVQIRYAVDHYRVDDGTVVNSTGPPSVIHEIVIPGFAAGQEYFYKVIARDFAGNTYTDNAPTSLRIPTFSDVNPPVLASVQIFPRNTFVTVEALFDERVTLEVAGFTGPALAPIIPEIHATSDMPAFGHSMTVRGLRPNEPYTFVLKFTDLSGNSATWPEGTVLARTARGLEITKLTSGRGNSFTTSANADLTPPQIVRLPRITSRSANSISIAWDTDEPADSRARFARIDNLPPAAKAARETDGTDYTDDVIITETTTEHHIVITQLDTSGTYEIEIASVDVSGNGETTAPPVTTTTTVTADVTPPVIVSGPTVLSKTHDRAVVRWVTDESADSQVDVLERGQPLEKRSTFNTGDFDTEHVVTLTNLKPNTLYDYLVSSYDVEQNGPVTALGEFTTLETPDTDPPVIVSAPTVVKFDDISAQLAWETNEAADTYVEYGTTQAYGMVAQSATKRTDHAITLTNLTAGTQYYFAIQAEDAAGNVYAQTTPGTFTTAAGPDVTPPAAPTNLTAVAGDGEVYVSWNTNSEPDFAGYEIERAIQGQAFAKIATNMTESQYLDQSTSNGVTYLYRIRAVDDSRMHNKSAYATSDAVTPEEGLGPEPPEFGPYYFLYYNIQTAEGALFRPVFKVTNPTPQPDPQTSVYSYQFVVATDAAFKNVIVTSQQVPPGDEIIGTQESWYWAALNVTMPDENRDHTRMIPDPTSTSWIPTRPLTPGQSYYWKVRTYDGIFFSPWSDTYEFGATSPVVLLDPRRATHFNINLNPEAPPERPVSVELATFQATGLAGAVQLNWSVRTDGEATGVIMTRSFSSTGPFTPIGGVNPLDGELLDVDARSGITYWYQLRVQLADGQTRELGLVSGAVALPNRFSVSQNAPNPFNPVTMIPYALPSESEITVAIYDVTGRMVRHLLRNERQSAGWYQLQWDGTDNAGRAVGSGVYLYRVTRVPVGDASQAEVSEREIVVQRMSLVR